MLSGLSHPASGMEDPRVVEAYVAAADLNEVVSDYWLARRGVDLSPNVFLHVAARLPSRVTPILLAADLFEHDGPRERGRSIELAKEFFR